MQIDRDKCRQHNTESHTIAMADGSMATAVILPTGKMVAFYHGSISVPSWVAKSFRK